MNELELETRLQRELKRVAGETRGPAPLAAQARYRRAEPPMAVISKLAVGLAAATIALAGSVAAAAAVGGSSPTDVAQAVKQVVQHCQNDQSQSGVGPGVTECMSSLVPKSLSLPVPTGAVSSGANPGPRTPAGAKASGRAQTKSGPSTIATGSPSQGLSPSAAASGLPGAAALASPSPAATSAPASAAAPSPSAVAIPTPSSTPPPTPTPTPTAVGSGPGVDPGPSPSPPAPTPVPSPAPRP